MKPARQGKKQPNTVRQQKDSVPKLSLQTEVPRNIAPAPPMEAEQGFTDQVDYQLFTAAQAINVCRADRVTLLLAINRERSCRTGLEETVTTLRQQLSLVNSKYAELRNNNYFLHQNNLELHSKHRAAEQLHQQLHGELTEARAAVNAHQQRAKASELDNSQLRQRCDEQSQTIKMQDDVIKGLRVQGQTEECDFGSPRRELEFLLDSTPLEVTKEAKTKRPWEGTQVESMQMPKRTRSD